MQHTAPHETRTRTAPAAVTDTPQAEAARTAADPARTAKDPAPARTRRVGLHDADGMAVASFVFGLVGLLTMSVVLGPAALVLAALALRRGTTRRYRAWLGMGLGVADLVVLAVVVDLNNAVSWSFGA